MRYLIMECHPGYAVALDSDGNFVKIANRRYCVGQLVTDVVLMRLPPEKKSRAWLYPLAAVAACIALLLTILLPFPQQPYASIYVKINPEVRIDVDKEAQVIGLTGINPDGEALIQGYDFRSKDLSCVTDELVDLAIGAGYLPADGQITILLDSEDPSWVDSHCQHLSAQLQAHLRESEYENIQIELHHENGHDRTEHHSSTRETEESGHSDVHGHKDDNTYQDVSEPQQDSSHENQHEEHHHGKEGK